MGIDPTKEPPRKIKIMIRGSIFARKFDWFTKEDIERERKEGDIALKRLVKFAEKYNP